jgi:hypothetical protein
MESKRIFHSPNACVQRVDVSIQVKPCFISKESVIQNGHTVANEIKKLITILMVLPLHLAALASMPSLCSMHDTLNLSEP